MDDSASVLLTRPLEGVAVAALNRPNRRNALTEDVFAGLGRVCAEVRADSSLRVLVVTGEGEDFCAGYDVDEIGRVASLPPAELLGLLERQAAVVADLHGLPQAVIAAVDGVAIGAGLSLALAADIRIMTIRARLRAYFVKMGLSGGDVGASWLLPRVAGLGFATEMLLTGRYVHAHEAHERGIAARVTTSEELCENVLDLAGEIAANGSVPVALTKRALQANAGAPSLESALAREAPLQVIAAKSPDVHKAVETFRGPAAQGEGSPA